MSPSVSWRPKNKRHMAGCRVTRCRTMADSRPGHIQRARNYSALNEPCKALRAIFFTFCLALVQLDLDVNARGKLELHQRVHGLVRRIDDIHQALVGTNLVLIACILVDVR